MAQGRRRWRRIRLRRPESPGLWVAFIRRYVRRWKGDDQPYTRSDATQIGRMRRLAHRLARLRKRTREEVLARLQNTFDEEFLRDLREQIEEMLTMR